MLRSLRIILLLLLLIPLSSAADTRTNLRVGIYDYKPLVYRDSDGVPGGFFVDIIRHIAVNEEWGLKFIHGTWQEGLDRLESGEVDLLLAVGYSEERAAKYEFTSESLLTDWGVVFRRADKQINSIMDLEGKTVGTLKGSIYALGFRQLANQFNVNTNIIEKGSLSDLFSSRSHERADAIVIGSIAGHSYSDNRNYLRTAINFTPVKIGIAALKGKNGVYLKAIDARVRVLKADKNSIYNRKLDELTSESRGGYSPFFRLSFMLLGGAFLVSIIFVVALTRIVRSKTERLEKSGKELELREQQFRLAMDASRDGLWDWDIVTGRLYFSPGYFRIIGFDPYELKHEFATWADRVHPDDYDRALKANLECIEGITESFSVEFRMLAKNGDWVWILGRGAAVARRKDRRATRVIGTHTDITTLVAARNALKDSEERLELATAAAHLGIWDWNLQSNDLVWNDRVFEIYGVNQTDSSITKRIWEEAIYADDRSETLQKLNSALKTDDLYEAEYRIVRPDNSIRFLKSFATIIRENGTAVRVIGMDTDITDHRMLEQQIRHTQKMDAVGRLAGGIAHDFNNKLTVILGYAELMKMLECAAETRCDNYLDEIVKAAYHSQEITRKLLAFSRDESPELCKVDLNYMLTEMQTTMGRLIGEQIEIRFAKGEGLWPVRMNPTEYDQIIMNLVVNARDAMPAGGWIVISTANESVADNLPGSQAPSVPGDYAVTAVKDNGCGMSDDLLGRIFDPFFTTKPAGKGTGLGLSTAYGIISRNRGFITVQSKVGEGAIFKVYIPRLDETVDNSAAEEEMDLLQGEGIILLVEDETAVRDMTQLFLESIGYSVIAAETPMAAVDLCKDNTINISCVLSDVIMPVMNGKQLQAEVNKIRPELPFIFMSGYTSDILTEQGIAEQGLHFIRKPLNFRILHEKLSRFSNKTAI